MEGEDRQSRQLRLVERKNGHGVVISKPLPADDNGDDSSKGKVRFDESGRDRHKDECLEDDKSYIPHTLSFRVYCNSSSDDNIQDDRNTGNMMDKQEEGAESHKILKDQHNVPCSFVVVSGKNKPMKTGM
ncbi:hypothetical protein V6N13_110792 [Hibiscus sabdariffa]|uniref:Uncharacterized protein n=1 Tax=Hibiscus sabdariffa TaxID=183260 RepID=A0ABR2TIK6_9ROSI